MYHQAGSIKILQRENEKTANKKARIQRGWNKVEQPIIQFIPILRWKWYD